MSFVDVLMVVFQYIGFPRHLIYAWKMIIVRRGPWTFLHAQPAAKPLWLAAEAGRGRPSGDRQLDTKQATLPVGRRAGRGQDTGRT